MRFGAQCLAHGRNSALQHRSKRGDQRQTPAQSSLNLMDAAGSRTMGAAGGRTTGLAAPKINCPFRRTRVGVITNVASALWTCAPQEGSGTMLIVAGPA